MISPAMIIIIAVISTLSPRPRQFYIRSTPTKASLFFVGTADDWGVSQAWFIFFALVS